MSIKTVKHKCKNRLEALPVTDKKLRSQSYLHFYFQEME